MSDRNYSVTLSLNAALGGQFASVMRAAQSQLNQLGSEAARAAARSSQSFRQLEAYNNRLRGTQNQVQKYRDLQSQVGETSLKAVQAQLKNAQLKQTYEDNKKQLQQMQEAYERFKQVRRENKRSMSADQYRLMGEQMRTMRQEISAQQRAVNDSRSAFNSQDRTVNNLNRQLQSQQQRLSELRSSLQQAGVSASQMAQDEARLQAEIERTNHAIQLQANAAQARQNHAQASQNLSNAYGNFQNSISTAQTLMSPFTSAVKTYADFDAAMSKVSATSGATGSDLEALTNQARQLGATTTFSASEAAEAMNFLAMAGWDTQKIMGGMPGLLSLAAAGGTDLATTADIVSDGMTAMGLVAGQQIPNHFGQMVDSTTHFADVMAATSSSANTNVNLMGETFKYAAATAGSLGYSIDDLAIATGLMANAGIKGSMAGTALRSTMTRLVKPPKDAATALAALGVSATKSDGSMKPFRQTIQELREKFAGLTESEKATYAAQIAGQEAMSGFLAMVTASDDDFKNLEDAIDRADGKSAEMQKTMTDNFSGAMKALSSASESVQISLGKVFEPAARSAAEFATQAAASFDTFIQKHQTAAQWAGVLAAGLGVVTVAAAGVQLAFAGWAFISGAVTAASAAVTAFAARVVALSVVQRIASVASAAWAGAQWLVNAAMMANPVGAVVAGVIALIAVIGGLISLCPGLSSALSGAWNDPQGAVHGFSTLVKNSVNDAVNYVMDRWNTLKSALANPIEAAINFFDHGDVIGGNVKSGESIRATAEAHQAVASSGGGGLGAMNQQIAQIDTQQAQAQVNELGNASTQAAQSTQNLAQNVETNSTAAQNLNQNITQVGEGVTQLQTNLNSVGDGANILSQNVSQTGEGFTNLQSQLPTVSTEFTNLQTNVNQTSPQITQLGQDSTQAAGLIQQLGSSASAAAGSVQSMDSAAGSVSAALSSKAAEISNIHISAPTVTSAPVAANAKGGIYKRGAFLTTFAEKSPEAAIPLDNSARARELWTQAGQALGTLPGKSPAPETPNTSAAEKIYSKRVEEVQKQVSQQTMPTLERGEQLQNVEKLNRAVGVQRHAGVSRETILSRKISTPPAIPNVSQAPQQKFSPPTVDKKITNFSPTLVQRQLPTTPVELKNLSSPNVSHETISLPKVSRETILSHTNFNPTMPTLERGEQIQNAEKLNRASRVQRHAGSAPKISSIDKIFSGSVKLPQSSFKLESAATGFNNKADGDFGGDGILGGLAKILSQSPSKSTASDSGSLPSSMPPISISITVQGNADAGTMRTAGNEMAVELKRQLDSWWREKSHDEQRRSFA